MFLFNGYLDYCSRSASIVKPFALSGFAVFCLDIAGVGHSEGKRGYIEDWNRTIVQDNLRFIRSVKSRYPALKTFFLGGSLGGATTLALSLEDANAADGIIAMCPAIDIDEKLYPFLRKIAKFVSWLYPTLAIGPPLSTQASMNDDPNVALSFQNDMLVHHGWIAARTGATMLELFEHLQRNLERITQPLLVLHGTRDTVVPLKWSEALHARVSSADKHIITFDAPHDFMHSPSFEQTAKTIIEWINVRV